MSYVRKSGRAEQRIADGMGQAVGIAVAQQAEVRFEPDAAEDKRAGLGDPVNVVSVADAKHGRAHA
jgi:hypothetical protein